jgi:hypothetical protein
MAVLQRLQDRRAKTGRGQAVTGRGGPSLIVGDDPSEIRWIVGDDRSEIGGGEEAWLYEEHMRGRPCEEAEYPSRPAYSEYPPWPSCTTISLLKT